MHFFFISKSSSLMAGWEFSLITTFREIKLLNLFWPMFHQDLLYTIIRSVQQIRPSSIVTIIQVQTSGIFSFISFQILAVFIWSVFNIQIMFFKLHFDLSDCRKNCSPIFSHKQSFELPPSPGFERRHFAMMQHHCKIILHCSGLRDAW